MIRINKTKYYNCTISVFEKRTKISTPLRNEDWLVERIFIKNSKQLQDAVDYLLCHRNLYDPIRRGIYTSDIEQRGKHLYAWYTYTLPIDEKIIGSGSIYV